MASSLRLMNYTKSEFRLKYVASFSSLRKTHDVTNQSRPLTNFDVFRSDASLKRSLKSFSARNEADETLLSDFGRSCGSQEMMTVADRAEKNIPVLQQYDNYGRRIDEVSYNPAYHILMKHGYEAGASSYGYNRPGENGAHLTRAALMYMENQLEPGHCCPLVMTSAAIPVLRKSLSGNKSRDQSFFRDVMEKLLSRVYDPRDIPLREKLGATAGMSMTEKQGGSDVRANTTLAFPEDPARTGEGCGYLLTGHKWFTSAPMSDVFLTLAKTSPSSPPSCFVVPRWRPDGGKNEGFRIMRLKSKLADRSNASSEIEYEGAYAMLIGEEGKGVKCIIDMVNCTRLDCTIGSAAGARRALTVSLNHAETRSAFGHNISSLPLMRNLLIDLCVEADASTTMAMRMAAAYDRIENKDCSDIEQEREYFRVGVSVSKYYVTKRQPNFAYECMEVLGGNGFVEDFPAARLFRQSPLNSIWEGSGNVIALDVLRAHKSLPSLFAEIKKCSGMDQTLDQFVRVLESDCYSVSKDPLSMKSQGEARGIVDRLALAMQASILLLHGSQQIASLFVASRIRASPSGCGTLGRNYGSFYYENCDSEQIIQENLPQFY